MSPDDFGPGPAVCRPFRTRGAVVRCAGVCCESASDAASGAAARCGAAVARCGAAPGAVACRDVAPDAASSDAACAAIGGSLSVSSSIRICIHASVHDAAVTAFQCNAAIAVSHGFVELKNTARRRLGTCRGPCAPERLGWRGMEREMLTSVREGVLASSVVDALGRDCVRSVRCQSDGWPGRRPPAYPKSSVIAVNENDVLGTVTVHMIQVTRDEAKSKTARTCSFSCESLIWP